MSNKMIRVLVCALAFTFIFGAFSAVSDESAADSTVIPGLFDHDVNIPTEISYSVLRYDEFSIMEGMNTYYVNGNYVLFQLSSDDGTANDILIKNNLNEEINTWCYFEDIGVIWLYLPNYLNHKYFLSYSLSFGDGDGDHLYWLIRTDIVALGFASTAKITMHDTLRIMTFADVGDIIAMPAGMDIDAVMTTSTETVLEFVPSAPGEYEVTADLSSYSSHWGIETLTIIVEEEPWMLFKDPTAPTPWYKEILHIRGYDLPVWSVLLMTMFAGIAIGLVIMCFRGE